MPDTPSSLPPTWQGPTGRYAILPEAPDTWRVSLGDTAVGTLIDLGDAGGNRWGIRVAGNDVAGVGSSWATWEDALLELSEFRDSVAS